MLRRLHDVQREALEASERAKRAIAINPLIRSIEDILLLFDRRHRRRMRRRPC